MSVIVCRQKRAEHPYFLEGLGVNIYTCQELCYGIYHHPLLFMDGIMDQNLVDFIRDEFGMGFVAARLEQRIKSGDRPEEVLFLFMQECDYYTTAELNRLRQTVAGLKKLPAFEYAKRKADYLVQFKQYGRAIAGYEEILEAGDGRGDDLFISRVWNNLGACRARIFRFKEAMEAFGKSYEKRKDMAVLERMYHLTLLNPKLQLREPYRSAVSEELMGRWKKDFEQAREAAKESEEVKGIRELFEKDSVRRLDGAAALVEEWKQEYRGMA